MGKPMDLHRIALLVLLAFAVPLAPSRAGTALRRFDIASQPAAAALNAFSRQADITLIFSYDLVADTTTRTLKGHYTINEGLTRLLDGTGLEYQQLGRDAFAICARARCVKPVPKTQTPRHRALPGSGSAATASQTGGRGLPANVEAGWRKNTPAPSSR